MIPSNPDEYSILAEFYDALYGWRIEDIVFYLEEACDHPGPLLEAGCGTGRITIPLAELVPEVYALDVSPAMLGILQEKRDRHRGLLIHPMLGDFSTFQTEIRFGQIIVPFRAFLHLLDQPSQLAALVNFHRHLQPGGRLIIDFFSPDYLMLSRKQSQSSLPEIQMEDGRLIRSVDLVSYDHKQQHIHVARRIQTIHPEGLQTETQTSFCLRYLFRYEMELLLMLSGFQVEAVWGGFDRRPYDYHSGEIIFIAQPL